MEVGRISVRSRLPPHPWKRGSGSLSCLHLCVVVEEDNAVNRVFLWWFLHFSMRQVICSRAPINCPYCCNSLRKWEKDRLIHQTFTMLQEFPQKYEPAQLFSTLIRGNVPTENQNIRMISEGSCDTEDWSNDAENTALHHSNKSHFSIYANTQQLY